MVDRDKYVFDFPRTEENRELYSSHIDWEKEELEDWDYSRWKIPYPSTRRWLDRRNPRDAGE